MAKILVRVLPNRRIHEAGALWVGGQTFYVEADRFDSLADTVVKVEGVEVLTGAMKEPELPKATHGRTGFPIPEELSQPRDLDTFDEPVTTSDDDSEEFLPPKKKTSQPVKPPAKKGGRK